MKKQLFLSSAALALAALVSCGGNNKVAGKVALICLHNKNSTYDANFINAFEAACKEAKAAGRISGYTYVTDIGENDECFKAAERFVNQGYTMIFSDSYGHDPYMRKAAAKYPSVFFSSATGDQSITAKIPNYHNAFASIYEGRYLAGVAAGKYLQTKFPKAEDHVLGYVGAHPYAEVISGFTAWYLGVKSVVNDVTMKVTYTDSWYDYDAEAAAATALMEAGCKVISQHADSMGAPNACKERGVANVSYNINTAAVDDTCADTYLAHSRINWKPYYDSALKAIAPGTGIDGEKEWNWNGTLEGGSVEYNVTDNTNLITEDQKAEVEAVAKQLKEGTLHVFDTKNFVVDPDRNEGATITTDKTEGKKGHLTQYDVDLRSFYAPTDTDESIIQPLYTYSEKTKSYYIAESARRSAPSFSLMIEGITAL